MAVPLDQLLPLPIRGRRVREPDAAYAEVVRRGLPTRLLDRLVRGGVITGVEAERLVAPRRTLAHRRQKRQPLSAAESDRLARVLRIVAYAQDTFGDPEKAGRWLRRPNRALAGREPLALLDTDGGARAVEAVLGRLAHGVY